MDWAGYIGNQFTGVWNMLRGKEWQEQFDLSEEGVFRSFLAIPLSLPLAVITSIEATNMVRQAGYRSEVLDTEMPLLWSAGLEILITLAVWALALQIQLWVMRKTEAVGAAVPLIVSYNWSILVLHMMNTVLVLATSVTGQLALLLTLSFLLQFFWFYFRWQLIREALQCDILPAVGTVALIFLSTSLVNDFVTIVGVRLYNAVTDVPIAVP